MSHNGTGPPVETRAIGNGVPSLSYEPKGRAMESWKVASPSAGHLLNRTAVSGAYRFASSADRENVG